MRAAVVGLVVGLIVVAVFAGFMFYQFEELKLNYTMLQRDFSELRQSYEQLQSKYSGLEKSYSELSSEYAALKSKYSELEESYINLQQSYRELSSKYSSLQSDYNSLKSEYEALKSKYSELSSKYAGLQKDYSELLLNYTSLRSDYEVLLNEYMKASERYDELAKRYSEVEMAAKDRAGLLDTWPKYIDYMSPEVTQAVTEAMKSWLGNPYTKIYNWIKGHISYNYDTPLIIPASINSTRPYYTHSDYVQYASETVELGHGDCEDQAILAAAMVLNYWVRYHNTTYKIYVVLIEGRGPDGPAGHAFTVIPVKGGKVIILDPAGEEITGLDLWIFRIVEPKDIREAITSYVNAWKTGGYYWYRVHAVFDQNDYIELDMSIDEFIKWLYQQAT